MKTFKWMVSGFLIQALTSCQPNTGTKTHPDSSITTNINEDTQCVSPDGAFATAPYLTKDAHGNPVICWTEQLPGEEKKSVLKYSVSSDGGETFRKPITVTPSTGTKAHHESMNKVAFKKNNTAVAVYSLSPANAENRFASDIFFTESSNGGKTWTKPQKVHKDTIGTSHSFFDLETLPNGEIGCCWLDPSTDEGGRPVMFAQTGKKGFVNETTVDLVACQCCRTELFVDNHGNINIAYRDILNDSIRDMVVTKSSDLGQTFSTPKRISKDNWVINGCPHTGPTMAFTGGKLQFAWFTQGSGKGLYYTESDDHGETFESRILVDEAARHPQMASINDEQLVMVWDEPYTENDQVYCHIVWQIRIAGETGPKQYISTENINAKFPVIIALNQQYVLVAWVQEKGEQSHIFCKKIKIQQSMLG